MRRLAAGFLIAASVILASCATSPNLSTDSPTMAEEKQCSDTPRDAISTFLRGIKEFSLALLRAVTPKGVSLYRVFGNDDEERGQEVVKQISENPEVMGASRSCTCSLLSMADTADPQVKIVVIKRLAMADDDLRDYKRAFRVRFAPQGNCILAIESIDAKWERIIEK